MSLTVPCHSETLDATEARIDVWSKWTNNDVENTANLTWFVKITYFEEKANKFAMKEIKKMYIKTIITHQWITRTNTIIPINFHSSHKFHILICSLSLSLSNVFIMPQSHAFYNLQRGHPGPRNEVVVTRRLSFFYNFQPECLLHANSTAFTSN